jgi:hypothetical protein
MPNCRPDPARERLWRKRLASWKACGLKDREFREREGVTPTAFAHWPKGIAIPDVYCPPAAPRGRHHHGGRHGTTGAGPRPGADRAAAAALQEADRAERDEEDVSGSRVAREAV